MAKFAALCLVIVVLVGAVAAQQPSRQEMKAMKRMWKQMGKSCAPLENCGVTRACKKCTQKCMKTSGNKAAFGALKKCVVSHSLSTSECVAASACGTRCMQEAFPNGRMGMSKPAKKAANLVARECMKECCTDAAACSRIQSCANIPICAQEVAVKSTLDACHAGQCSVQCATFPAAP